ncbi:Gga2p [Sugiyamaella lignohabitans]|uniref:Gga2p n=1 Tax=Sugiyamaella lignohabitans TaxID=796027 RepID=A0A167D9S4_9ASCO|nr:Gga2p [Sugiyamaella lignohabitans]ANB12655.1 Gga2p [Sugiyamaella lignohabitans]
MAVLDICVKNCGYPFHLQISRKEFLNELVRRFPEKPPVAYSKTQLLILESIEEWRQTICRTSRYKDDLGYIRDMHRLLTYKGYIFPEINRDDAAVLNPSDSLRSAQELEQEEKEAQSAKLQELIRRGTPADLQEANRLMSVMAGFRENKTDYRAKAAKDLDKLRRKAEILEEMLDHHQAENTIPDDGDDVFSDLISALKTARPKIQKMIDQEGEEDEEAVTKLLGLNDYIQSLIEKYDFLKNGDFTNAGQVAVNPIPGTEEGRRKRNVNNKAALIESLIDIDGDDNDAGIGSSSSTGATGGTSQQQNTGSASEDLLGAFDNLSFGGSGANTATGSGAGSGGFGNGFGQGGNISLGISTPSPPPSTISGSQLSIPTAPSLIGDFGTNSVYSGMSTPSLTTGTATIASTLLTASAGNATPKTHSRTSSLLDDSDWTNFESGSSSHAAGASAYPKSDVAVLDSTALSIHFDVVRQSGTEVSIKAIFSNKSATQPISNLNFQLAAPKSQLLRMEPQSGSNLPPLSQAGVVQNVRLTLSQPSEPGSAKLKLKWKVFFVLGPDSKELSGTIDNINV